MMMYEVSFATISERFFKGTSWPAEEQISDLVENDHVFGLLYKVKHSDRARAMKRCMCVRV